MDRGQETETVDAYQYSEWRAWRIVSDEFEKLGLNINDPRFNPVVRAIEAWGELLVDLRVHQSDPIRDRARQERLVACMRAIQSSR